MQRWDIYLPLADRSDIALSHGSGIGVGLGGQFAINSMPDALERYYGTDVPYRFQLFLRIRPSQHAH